MGILQRSLSPRAGLRPGAVVVCLAAAAAAAGLLPAAGAADLPRYYAHEAVHAPDGRIASWYGGANGPLDHRIRIAAETLKRFPWPAAGEAVMRAPHHIFSGTWAIAADGKITPRDPGDWANGDLGQRATSLLEGWVACYRYTGDPAAFAQVAWMADFLLGHCRTAADHPWPGLFISVPVKGKAYGDCDPQGMIQLDLCGSVGLGLLHAYQLTGERRWLEGARAWGEVLARKCRLEPGAAPWPRYANPEAAPWKDDKQTGGITMILAFLDELVRLGADSADGAIARARDAGRRHLREVLLPAWAVDETWGRYFWDWANPTQNCLTTPDAARYLLEHRDVFPNWSNDARNILSLFLNRSCVAQESRGGMFSGAWAYPEASNCCGRSLWYAPVCVAPTVARWGVLAGSAWGRELAVRQLILATYDVHDTGVTEDNIDGGVIVNGDWLNIAHPMPLRFLLEAIAWLPEELGPSRENHIVRSTAVVDSVAYGAGRIEWSTFDAPPGTIGILRLAFVPATVTAGGRPLALRKDLEANGYTVKALPNGDAIVSIRHDGERRVAVTGEESARILEDDGLAFEGSWRREADPAASGGGLRISEAAGAAATARFEGTRVWVIGRAGPGGGLADVEIDGARQLCPIDAWSPVSRGRGTLYWRSGLAPGAHTLRIIARGAGNPRSSGSEVAIDAVLTSAAQGIWAYPAATGPVEEARMVFGYTGRKDLLDSRGRSWRPGTEFVVRLGALRDPVIDSWWTSPAPGPIEGTPDSDLYRHGIHGREFQVNLTVGPGPQHLRLKFAALRGEAAAGPFSIWIGDRLAVRDFDLAATAAAAGAGASARAVDLVFNGIEPRHGAIEVRFKGARRSGPDGVIQGEAFLQALEVGPGPGGEGARPVSASLPPLTGNLLANSGFEGTVGGVLGGAGARSELAGWTCAFLGPLQGYAWQEADYAQHPDWGLPEIRTGKGAIRTHGDGGARNRILQEVEVSPATAYTASVWVRAADVRGKGFGRDPKDAATLMIEELDASGAVIRAHPPAAVTDAGPYRSLAVKFTTDPAAASVRCILEAVLACRYEEGHVTWDDASLSAAP